MKYKIGILIVAMLLSACGPRRVAPPPMPTKIIPQFANLTSSNVTIKAVDGSWTIRPNKAFKPAKIFNHPQATFSADVIKKHLGAYTDPALKGYVMDVKIKVGNKEELYGKIVFSSVWKSATSSSAKRMWTISVPGSYIKTARSGNVAVLYQPYKVKKHSHYNIGGEYVSWILWMSRLPL